jgi:hypothetical protein
MDVKQPVYIRDNVYASGALPFGPEKNAVVLAGDEVQALLVDKGAEVYLETQLPQAFDDVRVPVTTGADLEPVRIVNAEFEEPDGTPARPLTDLTGFVKSMSGVYPAGPIAALTSGVQRVRVW